MHVPDGILPAQVSAVGYAIATPFIGYCLRKISRSSQSSPLNTARAIPKAALLTATFFVASSLYLPLPPPLGTLHFLMNGLLGVLLGYYAVPALFIGLLFQALLLGHGGFLSLGINVLLLGIPALVAHHLFQLRHHLPARIQPSAAAGMLGAIAGSAGVIGSALLFFGIVITTIPADINAATEQAAVFGLVMLHLPLALIEGAFTASFVMFLLKTKPELLQNLGDGRSPHAARSRNMRNSANSSAKNGAKNSVNEIERV